MAQLTDGSTATLNKALHPEQGEDFSDWNVGRHTSTDHGLVVADWGGNVGRALRFRLAEGDPAWKGSLGYRAEVHLADTTPAGTRRLYEREIYVPRNWNQGSMPTWNDRILHQWHTAGGPGSSSPVLGLHYFNGSRLVIGRKNASGKWDTLGTIGVTLDTWMTERVEVYWTTGSDGYIDITLGNQHFRYDGPTLLGNYSVYEKVGVYGQGTLYYERNHQISTGLPPSQVTPSSTPSPTATPDSNGPLSTTPTATPSPTPTTAPTASPTPAPTASPTTDATSTPLIVFAEGFEAAILQQDSQNDWFRSSERAYEGAFAAQLDGRTLNGAITSPAIDLQGRTNASISFWWFIENQLDRGEYLVFQTSTDNGATWVEQARLVADQDPEHRWLRVDVGLTDIDNLRLRFLGKISLSKEDAHIDAISVLAQ